MSVDVLAEIPQATAQDVDTAVQAVKRAHDDARWRGLDPAKRISVLLKVVDALKKAGSDRAWADTLDHGKLLRAATGEIDSPVSFGGMKQSGMGRELGPHAGEADTQVTSVWVAT